MPIVPKNPADQIDFYTSHVPVWAGDPGAIGLTAAITDALAARLDQARAALADALAARDRSEAATAAYRAAVRELHGRGSAAIATIKAFAEVSDDPLVYARARIDAPRRRGPKRPMPGAPRITSAVVDARGGLVLEWRAAAGDPVGPSSGNYFEVLRRRDGLGEERSVIIGSTAGLRLRDAEIGPGTTVYTVRSRRGVEPGPESPPVAVRLPGLSSTARTIAAPARAAA